MQPIAPWLIESGRLPPRSATVGSGPCIQIIEGPIAFIALQESPPCFARAWVGYLAREKLMEIAAITSLVRQLSRQFPMNPFLAQEITSELSKIDGVLGVATRIQSLHVPLKRSGHDQSASRFSWRGLYNWRPSLRREFMDRCSQKLA